MVYITKISELSIQNQIFITIENYEILGIFNGIIYQKY